MSSSRAGACQAYYWDGEALPCDGVTTDPSHHYCRECWYVLVDEEDPENWPPIRDGQETRLCIGEKTVFKLTPSQWRGSPQLFPGSPLLIAVKAAKPHWLRADERNGGNCAVYVLRLGDNSVYVGHTGKAAEERIREHREGRGARVTRRLGVKESIYVLNVQGRVVAQTVEKFTAQLLESMGYRVHSA